MRQFVVFFVWMLHGSTKVVVRAVALLSAKTKWRVANSLEICFLESNKHKPNQKRKKHQPRCSLPESAGTGRCSLFLGRLDQGLSGNAESTHVNRPKGKAMLFSWVGRCCKFLKSNKLEFDYLRRICSAGWTWWKVALSICYCELSGFA